MNLDAIKIGDVVAVGPAYEMETGARTRHDEACGIWTVVGFYADGDLALVRGNVDVDGLDRGDAQMIVTRQRVTNFWDDGVYAHGALGGL
jgi:hypothetical protein